jgi:hypothetical protein
VAGAVEIESVGDWNKSRGKCFWGRRLFPTLCPCIVIVRRRAAHRDQADQELDAGNPKVGPRPIDRDDRVCLDVAGEVSRTDVTAAPIRATRWQPRVIEKIEHVGPTRQLSGLPGNT